MDKKVPFPQANDFNKVVKLLSVDEDYLEDNDFIKECINVTVDRQVSYYLSALMYLGIIDKDRKYTNLGTKIRKMSSQLKTVELVNLLLSDDIIRYAYSYEKVTAVPFSLKMAIEMIKKDYPDYSEGIYDRRGRSILSWVDWVKENTI